jgi:prepilin-type N-terminal cleavage/methylation domain-containing protein
MKPNKCLILHSQSGFTLLEIIAALTLFALVVFSLIGAGTSSRRNTKESERMTQAVQLVQSKMTEMEIKYQNKIDTSGTKASFNEEQGQFSEPNGDFSWKVEFKESNIKFTKETIIPLMKQLGIEEDLAEAQFDESRVIIGNLNQTITENFGELFVEVSWKDKNNTKRVPLVTHLIPKKPKINFLINPE